MERGDMDLLLLLWYTETAKTEDALREAACAIKALAEDR